MLKNIKYVRKKELYNKLGLGRKYLLLLPDGERGDPSRVIDYFYDNLHQFNFETIMVTNNWWKREIKASKVIFIPQGTDQVPTTPTQGGTEKKMDVSIEIGYSILYAPLRKVLKFKSNGLKEEVLSLENILTTLYV